MTKTASSREVVDGKRFIAALGTAILVAAVVGGASYAAFGLLDSGVRAQAVTLLIYAALAMTLCLFFKPFTDAPISLRFAGALSLAASIGIFVATVAAIVLFYYCLASIFGSLSSVARPIVTFATDAARLNGQASTAWIIAIIRACLLVPIFEEVFFRALLLSWLRKHMREELAIITMAALFALEHGSFIVAPYVFLFAIATGYIKLHTNSTLNTVVMHSLNNIILLTLGLRILHA